MVSVSSQCLPGRVCLHMSVHMRNTTIVFRTHSSTACSSSLYTQLRALSHVVTIVSCTFPRSENVILKGVWRLSRGCWQPSSQTSRSALHAAERHWLPVLDTDVFNRSLGTSRLPHPSPGPQSSPFIETATGDVRRAGQSLKSIQL